ncbi:MAG TPA: asparagine synthase C-terminal domain-containing protein, partial [Oculatellaceae cyanobacterium]
CNLLHYEDRNSMACSLESRLPFLDYRLVEFLFSLPPHFKIREAKTKFLLQETLKELIPASILNRKDKMGFSTPGQQWYVQQPETIHVFDSLMIHVPEPLADLDAAFLESIRRYWLQCKSGQPIRTQDEKAIWRYVTACFWLEQQSANLSKQRESYLLTC